MKVKLVIIFFMISSTFFAQEKYEYFGALRLNGEDTSLISYRLVFTEQNGKIKGYSVTDLAGEHETKNAISGTYNTKTKEFSFKEDDILYTKSTISDDMFCFINYTGKVKLVNDNSKVDGDFKGLFKNQTKCINGTLTLVGSNRLYKALGKLNNKIQKSKKVDAETKLKVNPVAILDSLKVNNLIKNQNLNVFWKSKSAGVELWDSGKEDGDMVNVYHNDKLILKNYIVTNKKKKIMVKLEEKNVFKITAVNEGEISPNTVMVLLTDEDRVFELMSSLKTSESATITIIKR